MTKDFTYLKMEDLDKRTNDNNYFNFHYKHGLTQETNDLIRERDELRKNIMRFPNGRKTILSIYKYIRNIITNNIR